MSRVRECDCRRSRFSMSSLRRLEGASDPADMMAVVAITCPICGARGTTILGFGPNSTEQDSTVLAALRDDRGDSTAPGNSAPRRDDRATRPRRSDRLVIEASWLFAGFAW